MNDEAWRGMLLGMAGLPARPEGSLGADDAHLQSWLARVIESSRSRDGELYRIDLHLSGDVLWRLPPRFEACF